MHYGKFFFMSPSKTIHPKTFTHLQDLPGIGKSIEKDLINLGYNKPADLRDADPSDMYGRWRHQKGIKEKCMLYVFRCAVHVVNTPPEKITEEEMNWWYWKDENWEKKKRI